MLSAFTADMLWNVIRLSTIRNAQRILVLTENGIEESGTHAELLAKGGIYQKLCEMSNLS